VPSGYTTAAFSANPAYANMAYGSSNLDVSTFLMTAWNPVAQGGYEINLAANLVLDSDYVTAVTNLASALGTSTFDSLLTTFANSYGATYAFFKLEIPFQKKPLDMHGLHFVSNFQKI